MEELALLQTFVKSDYLDRRLFNQPLLAALWAASAVVILVVLSLYSSLRMPDDIGIMGPEISGSPSAEGEMRNFRYIVAAVRQIAWFVTPHFHDLMLLWSASLIIGLLYSSWAFCRFARLPALTGPALAMLVALHGYSADLYNFPMAYANFGLSLLFVGGTLHALTKSGWAMDITAVACGLLCLFCYQPALLTILYAATIYSFKSALFREEGDHHASRPVYKAIAVFCGAAVLFLVVKQLAPDLGGRNVSASGISRHLGAYLQSIFDPFTNAGWARLFPLHERLVYGGALVGSILVCVVLALRRNSFATALALAALVASILITPGPFNLLATGIFWPSPRSVSAASFLHVGLALTLITTWNGKAANVAAFGLVLYVGALSASNHFNLAQTSRLQNRIDMETARAAIAALAKVADLKDGTEVAVSSGFESVTQLKEHPFMDFGLSAFSTEWSKVNILSVASGIAFTQREVPLGACEDASESGIRAELLGSVAVVCVP